MLFKNLVQNLLDVSGKNMNKIKKAQYLGSKVMEILKESIQKNEMKNKNYYKTGKSYAKEKISKQDESSVTFQLAKKSMLGSFNELTFIKQINKKYVYIIVIELFIYLV